jgi:hypothetical protein
MTTTTGLILTLYPEQIFAVFAALIAMTRDNHLVQDSLTEDQFIYAENLCKLLEDFLNDPSNHLRFPD